MLRGHYTKVYTRSITEDGPRMIHQGDSMIDLAPVQEKLTAIVTTQTDYAKASFEANKEYFEKHVAELGSATDRVVIRHREKIVDSQLMLERLADDADPFDADQRRAVHPHADGPTPQRPAIVPPG